MSIEISVAFVNEKSPYSVWSTSYGICFKTDFGVLYEVGFVEDYMLCESGVYQFFISVKEGIPLAKDDKVRLTVIRVLEAFFESSDAALVYICDTSDGRQGVRNRLFEIWFNDYERRNELEFLKGELTVDGVAYYANGIIPKSRKWKKDFCESFDYFMKSLKNK